MSDRNLAHAYPPLAALVQQLIDRFPTFFPNEFVIIKPIQVWRSLADQQALYAQNRPGRILTQDDGIVKVSKHQNTAPDGSPASLAVDLGVFDGGGKYRTELVYYKSLIAAEGLGLRWGGDFNCNHIISDDFWHDFDHVEFRGVPDYSYLTETPEPV